VLLQPVFEECSFVSWPEFFSEGILCEILPVPTPVALASSGTQPCPYLQMPTISESARTCSFQVMQKTAPESLVAKNEADRIHDCFYVPFALGGSLKHLPGCRGSTTPPQLPTPGWSHMQPVVCWADPCLFPCPFCPFSVLVWVNNLSLAAAEVSSLLKTKGWNTPRQPLVTKGLFP